MVKYIIEDLETPTVLFFPSLQTALPDSSTSSLLKSTAHPSLNQGYNLIILLFKETPIDRAIAEHFDRKR